MTNAVPDNPAGQLQTVASYDPAVRERLTQAIADAPVKMRQTVAGLTNEQLDTRYRNWRIRQIVHHLADSHVHSYIRFKWTLSEETPTIKAYEEGDWAVLEDAMNGDIAPSLSLMDGIHAKWVQVLQTMTAEQFARTFHHPQSGEYVSLWNALNYYAWHGQHHTAQIQWLCEKHGWSVGGAT